MSLLNIGIKQSSDHPNLSVITRWLLGTAFTPLPLKWIQNSSVEDNWILIHECCSVLTDRWKILVFILGVTEWVVIVTLRIKTRVFIPDDRVISLLELKKTLGWKSEISLRNQDSPVVLYLTDMDKNLHVSTKSLH